MLTKKTKAVATLITTAKTNDHQNESYQSCTQQSSENLKEKIGELLLYLQAPLSPEQRRKHWKRFEAKLRQYLDLKFIEVAE